MTSVEFDALPVQLQFDLVTKSGLQAASRENEFFVMTLYRVFDFYVEVKVRRYDEKTFLSTIVHDVLLVPYLDQVNLAGLLR